MSDVSIRPMLCKTFDEEKHIIDDEHPWYIEPKFDGLRCIIVVEPEYDEELYIWRATATAYSRNGKPFWNIDHILNELKQVFKDFKHGVVLDGELYTTDWNLSMGIVKSSKKKHPDAEKVKFHVWDYLNLDHWNVGGTVIELRDRKRELQDILPSSLQHTQQVGWKRVTSLDEARETYQTFLAAGFEGAVLKGPDSIYTLGVRHRMWLKWKDWTDADLRIVDAIEGEGKRMGMIGALQLAGPVEWKGKTYDVQTEVGSFRCTDEQLTEMWERHKRGELVGLTAEIRFQGITVEGACRCPSFYRLREDKDVEVKAKLAKPMIIEDPDAVEDYFDRLGG